MGDSGSDGDLELARELPGDEGEHALRAEDGDHASIAPGPTRGFWRAADWLPCSDGKSRPVEPGAFPLAHGVAGRVGRLRAYGNAIVSQAAAAFVTAALDAIGEVA
jgi:DNA (cytosine-5)-methyltransferase 1